MGTGWEQEKHTKENMGAEDFAQPWMSELNFDCREDLEK